ncbi:hypothetical protein DL766_006716 [Monosporascus sp. MC13-8B]|uniref:Uncharacterized protein n=1 Tax=Monosporascus cannonballus TaxID=155416 RepID=A0ABY0H562_9PEZI|nr:hypothetical protein DL762_005355 [Monosporascus cannonballus]RYO85555.1 hypothetical protein DL763_007069 [Monosporascus cannonballus]RYP26473.1 hypothetical protein DL766_006716 [Monosporascus sp. MC13-8B]
MGAEMEDKERNASVTSSSSSIPVAEPFGWLRPNSRGTAYVSYSEFSNHPACSFDFGHEGYAASCNYGGELLQMTAPSDKHGILFARGDFEYSLYLSVARGQMEYGRKSAFGLKLPSSSSPAENNRDPRFCLGRMVERGCYNYRWPLNEYALCVDTPGREVGTCSLLSFVKDGVLYQVLRLDFECHPSGPACKKAPDETELILKIDGPMRFQSFLSMSPSSKLERGSTKADILFKESCPTKYKHAFSIPWELEAASGIRWKAELFEFGIASGEYTKIPLKPFSKKEDHCSKDQGNTLPVYRGDMPKISNNGSRIFLASFRLYDPAEICGAPPTKIPKPEELSAFIELCEADIAARCSEKILDVDLVPAAFPRAAGWAPRPIALVSNLFLKATVDLNSLFWKTRFLVKVDRLLAKIIKTSCPEFQAPHEFNETLPVLEVDNQPQFEWTDEHLTHSLITTVQRIRHAIGNIVAYLVRALLENHDRDAVLLPEDFPGESKYYYVMITVWYVVKHYPEVKWGWQDDLKENGEQWSRGVLGDRLPSRRSNPLPSDRSDQASTRVKGCMLKWFHYESVLSLQKKDTHGTVIPAAWEADITKVNQLRFAAGKALARRISSGQPYRADDEIVDRLAFLAEELWPELVDVRVVTKRVVKRIETREFTRTIEAGPLAPGGWGGEDGYTGGPWEVHALCHHSRLVVAYKKMYDRDNAAPRAEREKEVEHYRTKFWPFLTSEASLTPCWERHNSAARRGFLRSEATAVLASTILDIFQEDLDYEGMQNQGLDRKAGSSSGDNRKKSSRGPASRPRFTSEPMNVQDLLERQLETLERLAGTKGVERHFDYLQFQPPQRYHPEEFFQSLDDTPELYTEPYIRDTPIPEAIWQALPRGDSKDITLEHLKDKKEMLRSLEIIDIKVPDPLPASSIPPLNDDRVQALSDSLIDQEVRHRLLVAPTPCGLPAELLRLFVYVLHPEVIDCLESHTRRVSKFVLQKRKTSVMAYITLRSWSLERSSDKTSNEVQDMAQFVSSFVNGKDVIGFPKSLEQVLLRNKNALGHSRKKPTDMALKVSSIGISTNEFGDFSKCSLQEAIDDFFGKLEFDSLSPSYLQNSDWLQSQDSDGELQLSLWGLEALYKLNNTMAESVRIIEQAKADLNKEIQDGPGKRSSELEKICVKHQQTLDRHFAELTAVQKTLERKVETISRYSNAAECYYSEAHIYHDWVSSGGPGGSEQLPPQVVLLTS